MSSSDNIELAGWLVIIDYRLFLVPKSFSDDYKNDEKIEIVGPELIFSVVDKILPLGGGESFIFHRAKLSGKVVKKNPLTVKPETLFVEERGGNFVEINVDEVERYRDKYVEFLKGRNIKSNDWLDFL